MPSGIEIHPLVRAAFETEAKQSILVPKGMEQGFMVYTMDLSRDTFVHFTSSDRALQILAEKKLSMSPPYKKFGPDKIYAISTVWGTLVPGTQMTHIKGNVVGLMFQTPTKPEIGFPEEVIWKRDVVLKHPRVLPYSRAAALIKQAPARPPERDNFYVLY
jgi:hypothetical protein